MNWRAVLSAVMTLFLTCCHGTASDLPKGELGATALLSRLAEAGPYVSSRGREFPRLERDDDTGELRKLLLTGMKLTQKEWAEVAKLPNLEVLILRETNVTDAVVRTLRQLPRLRWLNLCSTEITDQTMKTLEEFGSLRALCIADVRVSRTAVDRLKESFRERGERLGVGYSARKTTENGVTSE